MKKKSLCMLMALIGFLLLNGFSVAAAERQEGVYYGDDDTGDLEDRGPVYLDIDGVSYGCRFDPDSLRVTIRDIRTEKEEVVMPTYITYYGRDYKVDMVCETYAITDFISSSGFINARNAVVKLTSPKKSTVFDIEGAKWPILQTVEIGDKVKRLDLGGYLEAKVIVDPDNKHYKTSGSGLYSKNGKTFIHSFGRKHEIRVKKGTQTISSRAFCKNSWVEKVSMANTVKVIEGGKRSASAFGKCSSLREVVCSSNLEKIGKYSFVGCKKLSKIYINNKKKAPKIAKTAFDSTKAGIQFYVKNQTVAKDLKNQLKETRAKKFKIIITK